MGTSSLHLLFGQLMDLYMCQCVFLTRRPVSPIAISGRNRVNLEEKRPHIKFEEALNIFLLAREENCSKG